MYDDPPGPVTEAFASYYVRHLVQNAIDRAFKASEEPDGGRRSTVAAAGENPASRPD